ncbi:MAG: prepilin-type N-terminal cleavage/methylation domain-containing protein [Nitrospirae bacterium]|nr:prepilin-type N-terminal cleavage/methylation domain-containing protein [Nitrospirota bacterium]
MIHFNNVPLNLSFSKGKISFPLLEKGGKGGFERIFSSEKGVTLIELVIVILIVSIIAAGLSELLSIGLLSSRENRVKSELLDSANYAMNRMLSAVRETDVVLIPTNANAVRDILAISAMVDNDNDGRIDEDGSGDIGNDGQPGLAGFDDDGDGNTDEGGAGAKLDDDEDGSTDEDTQGDGLDNDSDSNYDEELIADMNSDGCPGVCSQDDDGDGSVDEGSVADDDEDGAVDEDPVDPLIYYVSSGSLYERKVVWNPSAGTNVITNNKLTDNVSQFRVERLLGVNGKTVIKIRIELSSGKSGNVVFESEAYPRMMRAVTP